MEHNESFVLTIHMKRRKQCFDHNIKENNKKKSKSFDFFMIFRLWRSRSWSVSSGFYQKHFLLQKSQKEPET